MALIVSRFEGQELIFETSDGVIRVKLFDFRPRESQVRLSIDAPKCVTVLRSEIVRSAGPVDATVDGMRSVEAHRREYERGLRDTHRGLLADLASGMDYAEDTARRLVSELFDKIDTCNRKAREWVDPGSASKPGDERLGVVFCMLKITDASMEAHILHKLFSEARAKRQAKVI